jgi:hypothetical protein
MSLFRLGPMLAIAWLAISDITLGQELALFGELPKLSPHWMLAAQGTNGPASFARSWMVLTNSQDGDILSFAAQQMRGKPFPDASVSWSDAAGDIFPGGYPARHRSGPTELTGHWIRNNVMDLSVVDDGNKTNVFTKTLEYTLVFEQKSGTNWLAHGYALALGGVRLFVQHTSAKAITPDLAHQMASGLIFQDITRRRMAEPAGRANRR